MQNIEQKFIKCTTNRADTMNYDLIPMLMKHRGITWRSIGDKLQGISARGLHKNLENKSMRVDTLEELSAVLEVDVRYFFDPALPSAEQVLQDAQEYRSQASEIQRLLDKIEEQEKILSEFRKVFASMKEAPGSGD